MKPERRYAGEIRVSGRTLSGPALVYGDIAPSHRERFLPGAFGDAVSGAPVALNLQHDPERVIARNGDGTDPVRLSRARSTFGPRCAKGRRSWR